MLTSEAAKDYYSKIDRKLYVSFMKIKI